MAGATIANVNVGVGADVRDFEQMAKKMEKSLKPLQQRMQKLGKGLTKYVTGGVVAAAAAIGGLAKKSAEASDRIDKMSQRLGISRKAFQEWDFILSQNGASIDSMETSFRTLAQRMDEAATGSDRYAEFFDRLGVSVQNTDGTLRSQEDTFFDVVASLQAMGSQAERTAIAAQLLGRGATSLGPLLNQTAGNVDDLRKKAHDLGLVLGDTTVDAGVEFTDTMDQLKRQMQSAATQIGTKFMPLIQDVLVPAIRNHVVPAMETLADRIEGMIKWWRELNPVAQSAIKALSAIAVGMGPVLWGLSRMLTLLPAAAKAVKLFGITAKGALISTGIGAAVVALGTAAWVLYENWDYVSQKLTILFNQIAAIGLKMVEKVLGAISKIPLIGNVFPGIESAVTSLGEAAERAALRAGDAALAFKEWQDLQASGSGGGEGTESPGTVTTPTVPGLSPDAADGLKEISQLYQDLGTDIDNLSNRKLVLGAEFDQRAAEVNLLQDAMVDLLDMGVSPTSEKFKALQERLNFLTPKVSEFMAVASEPVEIDLQFDSSFEDESPLAVLSQMQLRLQEIMPQMAQTIRDGFLDAGTGMLEGIGRMMAGAETMQGVVASVMSTLADLAVRVGKIAIAVGVGVEGIRNSLRTLNPAAAIAAGAALIVLGSAAKAQLASAANPGSYASSGVGTYQAEPVSNFGPDANWERGDTRGRVQEVDVNLIVEGTTTASGDMAFSFKQGTRKLERQGTDER